MASAVVGGLILEDMQKEISEAKVEVPFKSLFVKSCFYRGVYFGFFTAGFEAKGVKEIGNQDFFEAAVAGHMVLLKKSRLAAKVYVHTSSFFMRRKSLAFSHGLAYGAKVFNERLDLLALGAMINGTLSV